MSSIATNFTATGAGGALRVKSGDSFSYALAGTFSGTAVVERSRDGGASWQTVVTASGAVSGSFAVETSDGQSAAFRWRCTVYTSGTLETVLSDEANEVLGQGQTRWEDNAGEAVLRITESGVEASALTVGGVALVSATLTPPPSPDATSTDAYVTLFTHASATGLSGAGFILNTDAANDITVEEVVEDLAGNTATIETDLPQGSDPFLLSLAQLFSDGVNIAAPPIVSYRVRVKSKLPATPSTYSYSFRSQ